jgi:hypothetical protein
MRWRINACFRVRLHEVFAIGGGGPLRLGFALRVFCVGQKGAIS